MKKLLFKTSAVIAVMILVFIFTLSAFAASVKFFDEPGLISNEEASALASRLDELSNDLNIDIAVAVFNDMRDYGYNDIVSFADDSYDQNGFKEDGVILVMSMAERDYWISTAGYCITAITDAGIEYIEDNILSYLSGGNYYSAFTMFADSVSYLVNQANEGNIYDPYSSGYSAPELTRSEKIAAFNWPKHIVISLIIGFIVGFIVTGIMKGKLKSVHKRSNAANYVVPDSLKLSGSNEIFLYANVAAAPKPKDPPPQSRSSGGSSVHTSSGGVSHGGGGGKF